MVALMVLAVGLLAVAGSTDLSGRALARAHRTEAAVAVARATMDSLRWRSCDGSGTRTGASPVAIGGVRLGNQAWRVDPGAGGVRHLTDSVHLDGPPERRFALEGAVVCP